MKIYLEYVQLAALPLGSSKTQFGTLILFDSDAVLGPPCGLCVNPPRLSWFRQTFCFRDRPDNPQRDPRRVRAYRFTSLAKARVFIMLNEQVEQRARVNGSLGIKPLDALHFGVGQKRPKRILCTCDDRSLKKAQAISGLRQKRFLCRVDKRSGAMTLKWHWQKITN